MTAKENKRECKKCFLALCRNFVEFLTKNESINIEIGPCGLAKQRCLYIEIRNIEKDERLSKNLKYRP